MEDALVDVVCDLSLAPEEKALPLAQMVAGIKRCIQEDNAYMSELSILFSAVSQGHKKEDLPRPPELPKVHRKKHAEALLSPSVASQLEYATEGLSRARDQASSKHAYERVRNACHVADKRKRSAEGEQSVLDRLVSRAPSKFAAWVVNASLRHPDAHVKEVASHMAGLLVGSVKLPRAEDVLTVLDMTCAPGGWMEFVNGITPRPHRCIGLRFVSPSKGALELKSPMTWSQPQSPAYCHFYTPEEGHDGSLCDADQIARIHSWLDKAMPGGPSSANVVIGDGGMEVDFRVQEDAHFPLVLGQFIVILLAIEAHPSSIALVKVFGVHKELTLQLIWIMRNLFRDCILFKPLPFSRIGNGEKYIALRGPLFESTNEIRPLINALLETSNVFAIRRAVRGGKEVELHTLSDLCTVPAEIVARVRAYNDKICLARIDRLLTETHCMLFPYEIEAVSNQIHTPRMLEEVEFLQTMTTQIFQRARRKDPEAVFREFWGSLAPMLDSFMCPDNIQPDSTQFLFHLPSIRHDATTRRPQQALLHVHPCGTWNLLMLGGSPLVVTKLASARKIRQWAMDKKTMHKQGCLLPPGTLLLVWTFVQKQRNVREMWVLDCLSTYERQNLYQEPFLTRHWFASNLIRACAPLPESLVQPKTEVGIWPWRFCLPQLQLCPKGQEIPRLPPQNKSLLLRYQTRDHVRGEWSVVGQTREIPVQEIAPPEPPVPRSPRYSPPPSPVLFTPTTAEVITASLKRKSEIEHEHIDTDLAFLDIQNASWSK